MGLFKKDPCCLCGGKTGLFDKKCIDGKVCKDCSSRMSVWFDDYKNTTAEALRDQLQVKADDMSHISSFNFKKIFGEMGVILIDDEAKVFTAFPDTSSGLFSDPRNVRSIDDVIDLNPDIISFNQAKDFDIKITETTREEKQTVNGEQVSYNPPHIVYMYMFTLRMTIDHPYIKCVDIMLNKGAVQIKNVGYRQWTDPGRKLAAHLLHLPSMIKEEQAEVYDNDSLLDVFMRSKYEMPDYSYGFKCSLSNWESIQKYQYYLVMAREIKNIILGEEN